MVEVSSSVAANDDAAASLDDLLKQMPAIASAVNAFNSDMVQQRAFDALIGSLARPSSRPAAPVVEQTNGSNGHVGARRRRSTTNGRSPVQDVPEKRKRRAGPKAISLDLRPEGKTSFRDFVADKSPSGAYEQNTVAVYYLKQELLVDPVSLDHVHTCFLEADWRLPANMQNSLSKASMKGWLDTGDSNNIQITAQGINLVRHDLPHGKKS